MWRSSQSKAGLTTTRSPEDEALLAAIAKTVHLVSNAPPSLVVFDARSYLAAFGNKIAGKGFESKSNYKNLEMVFCDIDNQHAVREAWKKLRKVTNNPGHKFLSHLEHSNWLQTLSNILAASVNASIAMKKQKCILVHCSDGWDRTPQVCTLVQLFLDPYYRTLDGFAVLI